MRASGGTSACVRALAQVKLKLEGWNPNRESKRSGMRGKSKGDDKGSG
jgi:hypothetical protein